MPQSTVDKLTRKEREKYLQENLEFLQKATKELQDILQIENNPLQYESDDAEFVLQELIDGSEVIDYENDQFSDETTITLDELGLWKGKSIAEKEDTATKAKPLEELSECVNKKQLERIARKWKIFIDVRKQVDAAENAYIAKQILENEYNRHLGEIARKLHRKEKGYKKKRKAVKERPPSHQRMAANRFMEVIRKGQPKSRRELTQDIMREYVHINYANAYRYVMSFIDLSLEFNLIRELNNGKYVKNGRNEIRLDIRD